MEYQIDGYRATKDLLNIRSEAEKIERTWIVKGKPL